MKPKLQKLEPNRHHAKIISISSLSQDNASRNHSYSFKIHGDRTQADAMQPVPDEAYKQPQLPQFTTTSKRDQKTTNSTYKRFLPKPRMDVATCKEQIKQVVQQIKDLYHEGPIVDGWLESRHQTAPGEVTTVNYVKATYKFDQSEVTCEAPRPGYYLCGVDDLGQKWSYPCPMEQLPSVSLAIARYQKLQYLLARKRSLEAFLNRLQEREKKINN
ncbi:nitrogen regulatory protein P-II family [Gloeocapsa sp. PCC 7428]|uniref:nitrogen regulatory protein P-II family n=1 Tax=Gloeocapsa sp. PCC 7428 TaxID=1173026 RepID=UPI0002A5F42A|nr:nitrogen regulatory protein P-II family [Gloeocapsa sp. PCC 7428]AFZ32871.1 nitrogen regulatory protein P-II family [Gloeocapsa sp. PCC 7428]